MPLLGNQADYPHFLLPSNNQTNQNSFAYSELIIITQSRGMNFQSLEAKKKYERITYEERQTLIRMVQRDRLTIKEAGKMMGIKESTAKLIVSRFRTSGTIYETARDREARLKRKEEPQGAGEANISPILESHSKPVMPQTSIPSENGTATPSPAKVYMPLLLYGCSGIQSMPVFFMNYFPYA